jgi:glycosidase
VPIQAGLQDIEHHMLHFLENHDEQRIASPAFAGDPFKALPAMVVSATLSTSPTMVYFGQEVGEPGAEDAGFGAPSRTSIFDYVGVPHHQRWMNHGAFDGGQSSDAEKRLRDHYQTLLKLTVTEPAFAGQYADMHRWNVAETDGYHNQLFSYARWQPGARGQRLVVAVNFSNQPAQVTLQLPPHIATRWGALEGGVDLLTGAAQEVAQDRLTVALPPYGSRIVQVRGAAQ